MTARAAARLALAVLACAGVTNAQGTPRRPAVARVLVIADNQEHLLTGGPLKSFSRLSDTLVTSVGLRSPLANVGGRLLMGEALRLGRERGAGLVLHLGDATDISCEGELSSVFKALDREVPDKMWFITPGNHDGLLAGNFAEYQEPRDFDPARPSFYDEPPLGGYGAEKNIWYYACQSPDSPGADMPRGTAVKLYVERLRERLHVKPPKPEPEEQTLTFTGRRGPVHVTCRIEEVEIEPPPPSVVESYRAVARVCDPRREEGGTTEFGQYASFIVQRIDVGGTRIVLLDTSDYKEPTKKKFGLVPIGAVGGEVTDEQIKRAEPFFKDGDGKRLDRGKLIVAGHHPFSQLPKSTREWVAERAGRYMSAHVHASASLIGHEVGRDRLSELNVGSTLDYPPQAVFAELTSGPAFVRVAGADAHWSGFLERCDSSWELSEESYGGYRDGLYVGHLLTALGRARAKHADLFGRPSPALEIPTGRERGDWERLRRALKAVNEAEGDSRLFWACQAYFASKATRGEKGFLAEKVAPLFGRGFKRGREISGGWVSFTAP